MNGLVTLSNPEEIASAIHAEVCALRVRNTPNKRAVIRKYPRMLREADPRLILDVARALLKKHRWLAHELIANHRVAFRGLGEAEVEELGQGMSSWGSVNSFARTVAGPAWLRGQVPDDLIVRWARSEDRWWRRAALVSTVALNVRLQGGKGDANRTLAVCRLLVNDRDDMVVKAMSWALRALVVHDSDAVRGFLSEYEDLLAPRVKLEVGHKLATGLKSPRRERG